MDSPVRIVFQGDNVACLSLMGEARRLMVILENMMALRRLQQHSIRVQPYDGAWVICSKVFGQKTIEIQIGGWVPKKVVPPTECLCGCNYSIGWVVRVQDEPLTDDGSTLYTVMACFSKTHYVCVRDVIASDFTIYDPGWPVIMIPYAGMNYLCCTDNLGSGGATGCNPMKSVYPPEHTDWRTMYRIVPWCGLGIPRRIKRG